MAFDRAAVVHQDHVAFMPDLRRAAAVRKRGVLAKAAKDLALHAEIAKRGRTIAGEFLLRHAFAHGGPGRAIGNDGEVVRLLHQRDLSRRFVHATAGGYRSRADKLQLRGSLADAVVKKKAHALFDADPSRANPPIL